jgi:hypothetical protein
MKQSSRLLCEGVATRYAPSDAAPLPHIAPKPNSGVLSPRFLRLDSAVAPRVGNGSNATGGGNQAKAGTHSGDVRGRETTA